MLLACTWVGVPAQVSMSWYDQPCRDARQAVHDWPLITDEQRFVAEKQYELVLCRSNETWMQTQNAELVTAAGKAPSWLWKAFKAVQHDTCPVELTAQL